MFLLGSLGSLEELKVQGTSPVGAGLPVPKGQPGQHAATSLVMQSFSIFRTRGWGWVGWCAPAPPQCSVILSVVS